MSGRSDNFFARIVRCGVVFAILVLRGTAVIGDEQSNSSILKEYRQRVWTKDDGLPDNWVHCILQTRDGYLWIGTTSGLARFDGTKFTAFHHPALANHPAHVFMTEDLDGALWVGTPAGLLRYLDGQFTHYTTKDGLWDNYIFALHTGASGDVWVWEPKED